METNLTEEELIKRKLNKMKEQLLYEYAKASTKSKKKRLIYDLSYFTEMCYRHFEISDSNFNFDLLDLDEDINLILLNTIMEKKEEYLKMSESALMPFLQSSSIFYKHYGFIHPKIREEELSDILSSFFKSYDYNLYLSYKEKEQRAEVFNAELSDESGITYPIGALNRNIIFVEDYYDKTLFFGSALVHEVGHCFEFGLNYKVGRENICSELLTTPFYEISSRFFEYAFLRYLKENKIYENVADVLLDSHYIDIFDRNILINIMCKMKNLSIDNDTNTILNEIQVMAGIERMKKEMNYYELPSLGDTANIRDSFIYGIGSLCSIYLYENYKKDPNKFKKEFNNALLTYPLTKDISAFEEVGVSLEELQKGELLRKILKGR